MNSSITPIKWILAVGVSVYGGIGIPAFWHSAQAQTLSPEQMESIESIVLGQMETHHLNSLLLQVQLNGEEILTLAQGEAMTGVPITVEGHFRNGAVALAYVAALSLRLSQDGIIDLDAPIDTWIPDLAGGETATIRMLLNMTAGYPDHVANQDLFIEPLYRDPFINWTPESLIEISLSTPRYFEPGDNWDYSHSGYVILGQVLETASGKSMHDLMQEYILDPLQLDNTYGFDTATIPEPAIHAFTAERGVWEDSTYWNPSWTLPSGAIQVTTINDMARSFDTIIGHDGFLSADLRQQMISPLLIGFGTPLEGCPTCRTLTETGSYGLGAILQGDWVFQTPSFGGYASAVGTLPEEKSALGRLTIAAAVTYTEESFDDWSGSLTNRADEIVRLVAAALVPDNAPPLR